MNKKYMKIAIELAKKGKGKVYPNPLVGCVIVKDNKIVGKGWHQYFGGNHAEINALTDAGSAARGADLYVTLEPCNSFGKRPPCTQAIIKAAIKRVFFAVKDPNVSKSREILEKNGIEVCGGLCNAQAKVLIKDYLNHLKIKPRVSVKAAMTLDGKIATETFDSKWITSQKSRNFVHSLRSKYDAVLVGFNTALQDNPKLTSHGKGKNPVRVVIDENSNIPKNYNIFNSSAPTIIISGQGDGGVDFGAAKKNFKVIIKKLNDIGLKTILIEGGSGIISSAIFSKCVDDIYLFVAPKIIGGKNAISVVGGKGVKKIADAVNVEDMRVKKIGGDLLITGKLKNKQ
ncbi:bifunctional diaminohydroxyphosphoribosylaminopyrimidine deaminase/5-amino-6-(5-phosphoribosylamino)uracil reductase RibD [Endomicrobium proavitum]|nr:bifunctional diaminohydroxyphosphoribosylaminopyrimidine deaminase/5-amino-6-(5-phosphoribosylamino)uracil reductase RibD [Endomicrobium proavitum]